MKKKFQSIVKKVEYSEKEIEVFGLIDPNNKINLKETDLITIGYKTLPEFPGAEQYGAYIYIPRECAQSIIDQLERLK